MATLTISKSQLKELIKESISEVLKEERLTLIESIIPHVSKKEMNEIKKKYVSPQDYLISDFKDMTEWVNS